MAYKTKTITLGSSNMTYYRRDMYTEWYASMGSSHGTDYRRMDNYLNVGISYEDYNGDYYQSHYAYTRYTAITIKNDELLHSTPETAGEDKFELKIVLNGKFGTDSVMFAAGSALDTAKNVFIAGYDNGTYICDIAKDSRTVDVTIADEAAIRLIKTYGIVIAPVKLATPYDADKPKELMIRDGDEDIRLIHSYRNPATPGQIAPISPSDHGVLIANRDNVITYKYTQEYGYAMAYLGIKITSLETGKVRETKKYAASIASGGTGTYTIPAGTLAEGTYRFDFSGMTAAAPTYYPDSSPAWLGGTTAELSAKTNPEASTVTCDGKPVPTITWQSAGQAAFRVKFGTYDSGVIIGSGNSYKIPMIFPDGNYPVQIRVATNAGEWSAWTEIDYVAIKNTPMSGRVNLIAEKFGGNVRLAWTSTVSSPDNFAVFRGDKLIAVMSGTVYVDRFSAGDMEYHVLAVKGGNYVSSNTVTFTLTLPADLISSDGGLTYRALKYTPTRKSQDVEKSTAETLVYYAGRQRPVAISSGRKSRVRNCVYIFKTRGEADKIAEMEGTPVLLKTTRGYIIYGIMQELVHTDTKYPVLTFKIREIDREGDYVEYSV